MYTIFWTYNGINFDTVMHKACTKCSSDYQPISRFSCMPNETFIIKISTRLLHDK